MVLNENTISLVGYLDQQKVEQFLTDWYSLDVSNITILIDSEGGEIEQGFAIHDFIEYQITKMGERVNTIALGQCLSAATIVFLSGQTRDCNKSVSFMIHELTSTVEDLPFKRLQSYLTEVETYQDRMLDLYKEKSNQTKVWYEKMMEINSDFYFDKSLAKTIGWVNKV